MAAYRYNLKWSVPNARCLSGWPKTSINKSSSGDEMPERDVTYHLIWLFIYHWTTTHRYSTPDNFWSTTYISNGRRFTKSAFRILLLSTFRVSSINYSLACSLPIHTRSSTNNAEGPRDTISRNRVQCCINVRQIAFEKACNRWMTLKVIQCHHRCCHLISHIRFPISLPL